MGGFTTVAATPSQLTGDQDNWDVDASFIRASSDAARSVTGLQNGADGKSVIIANVGSYPIALKHQDGGSTAANRFLNVSGSLITLKPNEEALLVYDATVSRWRVKALTGISIFKSYSFRSRDTATGVNYLAGYYTAPAADANLGDGLASVAHGEANIPYAAHAFMVSQGNGSTDGSDLVLKVSGTSITDAGVRQAGDEETLVVDARTGQGINTYAETIKKWLGTVTWTLTSAGGTTFSFLINYGLTKYEDFGNRHFAITDFEAVGLSDATDGSFDIELMHHKAIGWTYHATAFVPGTGALLSMNTIHSTEQDLDAGEPFAFKRAALTTVVDGDDSEGIVIRVTTGAAKAVAYMDVHIGVKY